MNSAEITIPMAIFALFLTIAALILCIISVRRFKYDVKDRTSTQTQMESAVREVTYFQLTSQLSSICNVSCCASIALYCVWIIFQPQQRLQWFITLRALPTIFWFVAKASLIWLFNGRLWFAFRHSLFETSFRQFIFVNALIAVAVPTQIVCGYVGVWYSKYWMISFGFEGYRFLFTFLTFYLLFAFSKKLLLTHNYELSRRHRFAAKMMDISSHGSTESTGTATATTATTTAIGTSKPDALMTEKDMTMFVKIATKNAVLVFFISCSAVLVALCWTLFDYAVPEQNHLTLLLPLTMFAVDSVIDSACIFMLFVYGQTVYSRWCSSMDGCCKNLLLCVCPSDDAETGRYHLKYYARVYVFSCAVFAFYCVSLSSLR